ncbi:MAG TPA: molybdopterin-guanine dinucleotide biosynthesis protein B [Casimicrobiaceae bacterium]|nr:molybdopterin-guanine dinucleotide biosynthesis protein B [Casimicrobiaceae bacterium]
MLAPRVRAPVIGFAAISGTGKTTLLLSLIPLLTARGLRVGLIKRAHHSFDTDKPGKDSYELRKAGASQVLVGSDRRWALVVENEQPSEPDPFDLLGKLHTDALDLILIEGFKASPLPKIELHRPVLGHPLLAATDPYIIAVATDEPHRVHVHVPLLDLNDPADIAEFIVHYLSLGETLPQGEIESWRQQV